MTVIINPGSGAVAVAGEGWTNTYECARHTALVWLAGIREEGMTDVVLAESCTERDGRWCFTFTHQITGVSVELETHGIDHLGAYEKEHIFTPRVYWRGSSSDNPKLEDWAAEGFEPVRTYRRVTQPEEARM